jgi:hypothetical protein
MEHDEGVSRVVQTTTAAFAHAIDALRTDEVEVAAVLLEEIEVALGSLAASSVNNVATEVLADLWQTARDEAAAAGARLQSRAAQHGNSQRAARAYR